MIPRGYCSIPPYLFFKIPFYSSLHSPPGIQLYASYICIPPWGFFFFSFSFVDTLEDEWADEYESVE